MNVAVGSDHAGYDLKREIIQYLKTKNIDFTDFGVIDKVRSDYPDYGVKVGKAVASGEFEKGIVVCGTGIGISIAANKVKGVRAAVCTSEYMAEMARKHNDANIIAFGGRTTTIDYAIRMLDVFFDTEFEGGRHCKRVEKIHLLTEMKG